MTATTNDTLHMKKLYHTPLDCQKDKQLYNFVSELNNHDDVVIISYPEEFIVHERRGEDIQLETHIGYDYYYVTFLYKGWIFSVSAATFYPFTDENDPGEFNFVAYSRVRRTKMVQRTYKLAYEGLHSVDEWLNHPVSGLIHGLYVGGLNSICVGVTEKHADLIRSVVCGSVGGYRERDIWWSNSPILLKSETWNSEHRVIRVISDPSKCGIGDCVRSFEFDLITSRICG